MLATIKSKIFNLITESENADYIKSVLTGIYKDIEEYEKTNKALTDMHTAFRALEECNVDYAMEVEKYSALPEGNLKVRSTQVQLIMCKLTLMSSIISAVLSQYMSPKESSTIAKYLRQLNAKKEEVKEDKITWACVLKSLTTLITDQTQDKRLQEKEMALRADVNVQVDKKVE